MATSSEMWFAPTWVDPEWPSNAAYIANQSGPSSSASSSASSSSCDSSPTRRANDHLFYSNRSAAFIEVGRYEDALSDAQACVRMAPRWAKGYSREGRALMNLNRFDEAKRSYETGLALEPNNPSIINGIEQVSAAQSTPSNNGNQFYNNDSNVKVHAHNSSLYKTEVCRSFSDNGYCRYSNKCQFAHGLQDLRPVVRHRRWKTEKCKNFLNGSCPYGSRCDFIHVDDFGFSPDPPVTNAPTTTPPRTTISRPLSVGSAPFTPPVKIKPTPSKSSVKSPSPASPTVSPVKPIPSKKPADKRLPFFKHLVDENKRPGARRHDDSELVALMAQL